MNPSQTLRFILLASIWGASFLFQRVAVPAFGPVVMVTLRVLLGAIFMAGLCATLKAPLNLKANWKHYLFIGFFNVALPFFLFAYAAQTVNASILSILNATAAIWAAVISAIWYRKAPKLKALFGLILGIVGVVVLATSKPDHAATATHLFEANLGLLAGTLAGLCYAISSLYTREVPQMEPMATANGTLWVGALMLMPLVPFNPIHHAPDIWAIGALLGVGILSSGIAFYLYYGLIREMGAAKTMSIAYAIPVFGVLWGVLLLKEPFTLISILAGVCVLVAVALITDYNPLLMFKKAQNAAT